MINNNNNNKNTSYLMHSEALSTWEGMERE